MMIPQKMIISVLMLISLSGARLIVPDGIEPSSLLDRDLLDELNGKDPSWTEDEMKLYMQGVEDNTTVSTFSIKVFYSPEADEQSGGNIADMVDIMFDNMNQRLDDMGTLTRATLHCLEQMTWTEEEVYAKYGIIGGNSNYKDEDRNSADAVFYISTQGGCGWGVMGGGLSRSFQSFGSNLVSWIEMGCVMNGGVAVHEVGHNLGLSHTEMESEAYYGRVFKEFRFALAAVGDESEPCPKQEADWEFRSRCFKSFGTYSGGELENEGRTTTEKSAKECQARCAATEGCSFFSFKDVGADCRMSSSAAKPTFDKGIVGGPVSCDIGETESDVNSTKCYDEELDPKGEKYDGFANTTVSGRTCRTWDSHGRFPSEESNFCRNPDGEPAPWCYTTDPDKDWELCSPELRCSAQGCFKANIKYSPIDPPFQRSMEKSAEACKARCALSPNCAFFNFWEEKLPDDNGCTLFGSEATFGGENETDLYVTGPVTCPDYVDPMADCQIEQETDYTGMDLSSGPAESQQDCADICASTQLGLVWTFTWGKNCYIKRSITGRVNNPNAVSGNYKCGSKIAVGPGCVNSTQCYDGDLDPKGEAYDGCVSTTVSGRTCQDWGKLFPHSHKYTSLVKESNNCRNPTGDSKGPWCYTTDPYVRSEYCSELRCGRDGTGCVNSTKCYDGYLDPKGEAYDGCVSTTESGKTCQDWGINDNPYKALWRESNNCRNPNKFLRPWCYTSDTTWEYCSVQCGADDDWMSECQIDQETDYTGTDLASIGVGSQQECADLCASTKNGLVWTWIYGYCYIKSSITGRVNNPNAVSGNYKCGSDLPDCSTTGGSAEGRECKFPFDYKGVSYNTCTLVDHSQLWCYTESGWGNCRPSWDGKGWNTTCPGGSERV